MCHPNPIDVQRDLGVARVMPVACLENETSASHCDRYGIPIRTKIPGRPQPRPRRVCDGIGVWRAVGRGGGGCGGSVPGGDWRNLAPASRDKGGGIMVGVLIFANLRQSLKGCRRMLILRLAAQAANARALANQPATTARQPQIISDPAGGVSMQGETFERAADRVTAPPDAVAAAFPWRGYSETSAASEVLRHHPKAFVAAQQSTYGWQSSSRNKTEKQGTSTSSPRHGRLRVECLGITSDGRLIIGWPRADTRIVAPDSDDNQFGPRSHRLAGIQRDPKYAPPPPLGRIIFLTIRSQAGAREARRHNGS